MNFNWSAFGLLILYTLIVYAKAYSEGKKHRKVVSTSEELEFYKAFAAALNIDSLIKEGIIDKNLTNQQKIAKASFPLILKEAAFRKEWNKKK